MKSVCLKHALIVLFAVLLSGCAGRNFVRPDSQTLKNGQTSRSSVIELYGDPFAEGTEIKNEKLLNKFTYAYASVGGKPLHQDVIPARAIGFYFLNDILVGHNFISSWAEDHSDFDDSKVPFIVKGKTTRIEVIQLLGKPCGYYIYPLIKASSGEAAVYMYTETVKTMFKRKTFRKSLVITFDESGVVTDVEFNSSGVS
jgi:hypothetical protein